MQPKEEKVMKDKLNKIIYVVEMSNSNSEEKEIEKSNEESEESEKEGVKELKKKKKKKVKGIPRESPLKSKWEKHLKIWNWGWYDIALLFLIIALIVIASLMLTVLI